MSDNTVEYLVLGLLVAVVLLLACYSRISIKLNKESFGIDNKPFEPENTLLHRNPWDDIDYIVPTFVV